METVGTVGNNGSILMNKAQIAYIRFFGQKSIRQLFSNSNENEKRNSCIIYTFRGIISVVLSLKYETMAFYF